MRKKTPQDYANELLQMYRENAAVLAQSNEVRNETIATPQFEDESGGLQINVTTVGRLYPVTNALVTVFVGEGQNKRIVEKGITDQSGKSGIFNLKTPSAADSQQAQNGGDVPYARYNVSVQSDGYVEQIAMNVPVFSGVLSVQGIDLLPVSAAGGHTSPQVIQEGGDYDL